jgi:hypothetical protein
VKYVFMGDSNMDEEKERRNIYNTSIISY